MSSRARVRLIVGAVAVAAAAVAAVVAWAGRADDGTVAPEAGGARDGTPPLALDALVSDPAEGVALASAAQLYQDGELRAALDAFREIEADHPDSLYAAVGAALALWPDGTIEELRALEERAPSSALVELHVGLALFWQGREQEAQDAWERAEQLEPDTPAALRAESLLHPEMPAGRPYFVPSTDLPQELANRLPFEQLEELRARAEGAAEATPWLQYGVALQRAGMPLSAQAAFDRAVALAPDDPETLVAAAVVRFDKDNPSQTFSRLGPLSDRFPDSPVVRFHLGLCLLWLREVDEARNQLGQAIEHGDGTVWGREAQRFLDRLEEAETTTG